MTSTHYARYEDWKTVFYYFSLAAIEIFDRLSEEQLTGLMEQNEVIMSCMVHVSYLMTIIDTLTS